MKLSVIIVNYNVRYFLEQAVRSTLDGLEGLDAELIVVDNASIDGSQAMMGDVFPEVHYIYLTENQGFSKANNIGIEASQGEYVLLLNPDTVVSENAFTKCIEFMDSHPDAGGLGVHMIDGNGAFLPESKRGLPTPKAAFYKIFGLSALLPKSERFGKYHLGFLGKEECHSVEILSGAYMMMRKEALDKAGLLDETFFMYGEDIDLSYRLIKAGYKNYYFPEARIIHYKGESTKKGSVNYVFVFYRAMVIFAKKHFDKGQASLFGFLIEGAIYFRAALAISRRLFGGLWQSVIDGILIYGIFLMATQWYGQVANKQFELPFIRSVLLGYTFLTLGVLLYAGVYDQRFRFSRLIRGWVVAFLLLLGFYSLLPESYRFSRAVLLMGSAGALLAGVLWRYFIHVINSTAFPIHRGKAGRFAVIGGVSSLVEVTNFLEKHRLTTEFVCGVDVNRQTHYALGYVGGIDDIDSILDDFQISDLIFDTRCITNADMIRLMEQNAEKGVRYRMVAGDPMFLIGSQASIGADDIIARGELESMNVQSIRRAKRTFDLFASLVILCISPLLLFITDDKLGLFKNAWMVISSQKSWVGYDPRGLHEALPELKKGITYDRMNVIVPESGHQQCITENVNYLKGYNGFKDASVLLKNLHELGSRTN
ncbi:MAG: glycosyltransferase [Cryomorphaceae bacterium]